MEYNLPSEIVKQLNFGSEAKNKIIAGVQKLAKAVKSTLGASGKCVIYEDGRGKPVITKDGVTVAESVVLYDPVENMGATLIKEAARNTVKEAGDGTTTATVLAEALIKEVNKEEYKDISIRDIKNGINSALDKVNKYLTDTAIGGDRLVIASLYTQSIGQDTFSNSASLICRFTGTIDNAAVNDTTVTWTVSPAISKQKAQVPSRRISSDLMGRFVGT